jgi:hypothetical protein
LQRSAPVVVETADGSWIVFEKKLHDIVIGSATAQLHEKEMDWKISLRVGDGKAPFIDKGFEDCEIGVEESRAVNGQVLSIIEDANSVGIGLEDCTDQPVLGSVAKSEVKCQIAFIVASLSLSRLQSTSMCLEQGKASLGGTPVPYGLMQRQVPICILFRQARGRRVRQNQVQVGQEAFWVR